MENLKTVILTNNKNRDFKAILNLKNKEGSIKFFTSSLTASNLALGIKQDSNILKIPLKLNGSNCNFQLPQVLDYQKKFMCAVVDVSNAFCPEIVLSGSVNKASENDKIETAFVQTKPKDTSVLYEEDSDLQIESLVEKNIEEDEKSIYYDTCSNCKYRKAFYEEGCCCSARERNIDNSALKQQNEYDAEEKNIVYKSSNGYVESLSNEKNVNLEINSPINEKSISDLDGSKTESALSNVNYAEGSDSFYYQVKPQLDALFDRYKSDDILNGIIANSKWVRVAYDGGAEFYVLGLIYNERDSQQVDFICYGVPSSSPDNPPEDIKDYAQWLPIDMEKEKGDGYFIVYQNAFTGETVSVNFV